MASAAALAALFGVAGCGSGGSSASTTTSAPSTTVPETTLAIPPSTLPATTATTATVTAAPGPPTTRRSTTTRSQPSTTSSTAVQPTCVTNASGGQTCSIPGRPIRRRRGLLLPAVRGGADRTGDEARAEYASVAAFGELALRLLAVGAPAELVAACHRAALDEIRHASVCDDLAGRPPSPFGAIPGLLGRPLGGWRRSRRVQLQRIAVESFLDGWVNEGAAAAELRERAERASTPEDQARLNAMADDEQRHADLARSIVTWCVDQDPAAVSRALAQVTPLVAAA